MLSCKQNFLFSHRKGGIDHLDQVFSLNCYSTTPFFDFFKFYNSFFEKQIIALEKIHECFLKIEVLDKCPTFIGLFESRIKSLRSRIESGYEIIIERQREIAQRKK